MYIKNLLNVKEYEILRKVSDYKKSFLLNVKVTPEERANNCTLEIEYCTLNEELIIVHCSLKIVH